jgi:phage terminase small subunit
MVKCSMARQRTLQQEKFVDELLKDPSGNISAAARRAGYSAKSAGRIASKLVKTDHIADEIRRRRAWLARSAETDGITPQAIVRRTAAIALGNLANLLNIADDGTMTLKPLNQLHPDDQVALHSISLSKSGKVRRVQVKDSLRALQMLATHLGLRFTPDDNDTRR